MHDGWSARPLAKISSVHDRLILMQIIVSVVKTQILRSLSDGIEVAIDVVMSNDKL